MTDETHRDLTAESDSLHERVRAFARAALGGAPRESFDDLAVDIARFQARHLPGVRRLFEARGGLGATADRIPAIPVDAFRLTRVAVHPAKLDVAGFRTSGTTAAPGFHALRTLGTYRELSLAWGSRALTSAHPGPRVVVALAVPPLETEFSSLGFMMRTFMEEWDGRALGGDAAFDVRDPSRWLLGESGVDVEGLRRAGEVALSRAEPLLVLATGFALVLLLDALQGSTVRAPATTVVMPTGGFKGRTREVDPDVLSREIARAFRIPEEQVVFEYGMTELSSQLYDGGPAGARGTYVPPPWLRVTAVDPETLSAVAPGEAGLARFTDLANVDSAVSLVTQDLVRHRGAGVELLGRRPGATPRGCSLAVEDMVLGAGA